MVVPSVLSKLNYAKPLNGSIFEFVATKCNGPGMAKSEGGYTMHCTECVEAFLERKLVVRPFLRLLKQYF